MTTLSPPSNPLRAGVLEDLSVDPCVLVIFGASGDLTGRKLLPGVYALAKNRMLPSAFGLVGFARRPMTDRELCAKMRGAVDKYARQKPVDDLVWDDLARGMRYVQGAFDDAAAYEKLRVTLDELDRQRGTRGGRTFYLAVPPDAVRTIVENLVRAGLCPPPGTGSAPYARVIVEKPFGVDLASAKQLNRDLLGLLDERQVFRIDHYLGKETVQNLLVLRFGNTIFEPIWNRNHVSHVELTVAEHIGMEGRGKFYEQTGLMRDIVQNHALQLLSLVAMEAPVAWTPTPCATRRSRRCARCARSGRWKRCSATRCAASTTPAWCAATRCRVIAKSPTWRKTARSRPMWQSPPGWTTGAGPTCRSTCAPASAWASA
jgi:glucose-6-phosphate 1-dehydrogenase